MSLLKPIINSSHRKIYSLFLYVRFAKFYGILMMKFSLSPYHILRILPPPQSLSLSPCHNQKANYGKIHFIMGKLGSKSGVFLFGLNLQCNDQFGRNLLYVILKECISYF